MKHLLLTIMKPSILVGGQAVIEGVMMRVPGAYATAVRDPEGNVHVDKHDFTSRVETSWSWRKPILRGMMALFESMKMGMKTLQWSADIAMPEETAKQPGKLANFLSMVFAIILAVGMFVVAPLGLTTWLLDIEREAVAFNMISGLFRISFFILYLLAISMMKDVKRLFRFHGAEHRVVFNFESGKDVNVDNAQSFSTYHPRCGTSFLFIVLISAIIVFALIDTVIIAVFGEITILYRIAFHLPLMPLVAGLSYEVIKITARKENVLFFRALRAPGLWLQRITTQPPENDMVAVAITALQHAFGEKYDEMVGREYIAEAIG
ncbi:MAG TPA: DUF1385 domain-containing protein [Candidatus Marinimicrobia bacterium]|nr:DUF1385 domain-containing protein [Candidatus Neomarinimicrobiota bacterium]MDP7330739.1 DUF1385 domain-containing protein [Candidatus Neomarinimicrobiota bacterium]HBN45246.1 DUF1385 domain-containing protein [Candidatus Neomarinimicrobiota bacterium]HJL75290.1 DUF1385 domain-containing protein [Candidatus Neomarinimicrobiota bacterium]HJM70352.1 DUF1385 domain-containing protein [Candidatus Neomarinimicrobiota bacterium]